MYVYACVSVCVFPSTYTYSKTRQEYWSGLPYSLPEDLPDPGNEPASLTSPVLAGGFFTTTTNLGSPE